MTACSFYLLNSCSAAEATASLSIGNPSMTSTPVSEGGIATVSTKVTVDVQNAESYSLTLTIDNANLTNGNTALTPGNAITNNTWGYKWDKDGAATYKAPSTTGTSLTVPDLIDNKMNFEGTLTFAAKFGNNADAGHYQGSGKLNLVATPKKVTTIYTLTYDDNTDGEIYDNEIGLPVFTKAFPVQSSPDNYEGDSYTFTISTEQPYCAITSCLYKVKGWSTVSGGIFGAVEYGPGTQITAYKDAPAITLYAKWGDMADCW